MFASDSSQVDANNVGGKTLTFMVDNPVLPGR